MGLFDDLKTELRKYARDRIDVAFDLDYGTTLRAGEDWNVSIQLTNEGPLRLKDVKIRVSGVNGTRVGQRGQTTLVRSFDLVADKLDPGKTVTFTELWGRVSTRDAGTYDLLEVEVLEWGTGGRDHPGLKSDFGLGYSSGVNAKFSYADTVLLD